MGTYPTIVPCTGCGKNVRWDAAMTVKGEGSYHSNCAREASMGMRVELNSKQEKELAKLKETPVQQTLMGHCAQCGRGIPHGYVPVVTKYESVVVGNSKVAKAVEMYCKDCSPSVAKKTEKKKAPVVEITSGPVNADLAKKLMSVMSTTKPHSPRWMLKRLKQAAELKNEAIKTLKQLQSSGKVEFSEGQWLLK